ncbi:MAG: polysaccharide biosynthesis protein PelF [Clostridiales bacterium]|nr:polysaccharide biosynthesis protein PelF [Clostridiales bacterium]
MKVCIIAEGCYPYIMGGVSGWIQSLIKSFPDIEYRVLTIVANRSMRGKFTYELPSNVSDVHELYLEDYDWFEGRKNRTRESFLHKKEQKALRALVLNQEVDWEVLFAIFQNKKTSINDLLMGEDFMKVVTDCYQLRYSEIIYSDFLWTMRSIYLPLFFTMKMKIPKADIYHCVATGYAGVLGSMGKVFYGSKLLISEHGIYTREREEELIKAKWVTGIYKNIWIEQFKKMSKLAYEKADMVTSLYMHARELQVELGCPIEKTRITPNGISIERLFDLPGKTLLEKDDINVGAILRVTPIKDVKTMIRAFAYAKAKKKPLKLWIMGPLDEDEEYARECFELVDSMKVEDVIFTGKVDIREYLGKMDMTILTSISEGQPLTILESFAAKKPVIATDVGNCKGLIYGEDDEFGEAGILTHIMNIEEITQAILDLANDPVRREKLGENGYLRVTKKYQIEEMKDTYATIYQTLMKQ